MADGGSFTDGAARLVPGQALAARCRCGRQAPIDPRPWLAQGLGGAALHRLEARLRCLCGARSVSLQPAAPSPISSPAAAFAIWVFR